MIISNDATSFLLERVDSSPLYHILTNFARGKSISFEMLFCYISFFRFFASFFDKSGSRACARARGQTKRRKCDSNHVRSWGRKNAPGAFFRLYKSFYPISWFKSSWSLSVLSGTSLSASVTRLENSIRRSRSLFSTSPNISSYACRDASFSA